MDKINFNEKIKNNVIELARQINNLQTQLRVICQTVADMNNQDPSEYALASDFSGIVKIKRDNEKEEKEAKNT